MWQGGSSGRWRTGGSSGAAPTVRAFEVALGDAWALVLPMLLCQGLSAASLLMALVVFLA